MKLVFTLPGNWTGAWILLRLLEVVESPWRATELGFANLETGESAMLAMARAIPEVSRVFADGTDPARPPMDDDLIEQIAQHKAIVQVTGDLEADRPLQSLRTVLRATNAIVDGGALAVQCGNSGLVHSADAFQALMVAVEAAGDDEDALRRALFQVVVRFMLGDDGGIAGDEGRLPAMTLGMHTLGRPDVMLSEVLSADRAVGKLERIALGPVPASVPRDSRSLPEIVRNPYGLVQA
ncbi:MAG: hypothetical protein R3F61_34935 [Myxococcota bacterium]